MQRIFSMAIRENLLDKNPCWKVKMLPENNARDRVLSAEEYDRLIRELPRHIVPIVKVAYLTGMRLGEILSLTWDRVFLGEGFINLEPEDTKTNEPRHIYFNSELREIFMEA